MEGGYKPSFFAIVHTSYAPLLALLSHGNDLGYRNHIILVASPSATCAASLRFGSVLNCCARGSTNGISDDEHTVNTNISIRWHSGSSMFTAKQFIAQW